MTTLALLIPVALAWVYAMAGGIEFGLPFVWLFAPDNDRARMASYLGPAWETTNVFAVMAFTSFVILFPKALNLASDRLHGILLLAGGLLLLRALLVLLHFYAKIEHRLLMPILALVSLLLIGLLSQIPLQLLVGAHPGILAQLAFAAYGMLTSLTLAAGFFAWRVDCSPSIRALASYASMGCVAITVLVILILNGLRPDMGADSALAWALVALLLLTLLIAAILQRPRLITALTILASLALWSIIFAHQPPYLFFPDMTLSDALTQTPSTVAIILAATAFFTVILAPFAFWLYTTALRGEY